MAETRGPGHPHCVSAIFNSLDDTQGKGEVFCRRMVALGAEMALFPVALQRIPL
jgi:hypothetical protein